jgi:transposase InsO family protein
MPWKETCVMDLKMQMVADCLKGEHTVADVARSYGVARKTVYKWLARYENEGAAGLEGRSHAPIHCPHAIDDAVAEPIIAVKRAHPSFGPKKVMDWLRRQYPDRTWPADSTAGELLKRVGLVKKRRYKRLYPADPQPFELGHTANALWSADYKGQYPCSQAGQWCYPLTITDNASRYLIRCQGVRTTRHDQARPVFEWAFQEYGLPEGMLSDNGPPFASRAAGGLTRLSLWWVRQGIKVHRTKPGTPTQNARHERMHGTLNRAIGPQMRGASRVRQQELLSHFRHEYNDERSHEGLGRQIPASSFVASTRPYTKVLLPIHYQDDQQVRSVRHNGEIKFKGRMIYVADLLATLPVGLREVDNDRFEVRICEHLLGYLDLNKECLEKATQWHLPDEENV